MQTWWGLGPHGALQDAAQGGAGGQVWKVNGQLHRRIPDPHVVDAAGGHKHGVAVGARPDGVGQGMPESAAAQAAQVVPLGGGEEAGNEGGGRSFLSVDEGL